MYESGAASLFASAARTTSDRFEDACEFIKGRKSVSTKELKDALGINSMDAYLLMSRMEKEGLISPKWEITLGGFPVLGGGQ